MFCGPSIILANVESLILFQGQFFPGIHDESGAFPKPNAFWEHYHVADE
jgi:hypothetical protein